MKKTAISLVLALAMVFSLVLVAAPAAEAAAHTTHCVCGGKANGIGDHTCANVTEAWQDLNAVVGAVAAGEKINLATGSYYLSADLNLPDNQPLRIDENAVVTICLNGKKLNGSTTGSDNRTIYSSKACTINICDCSADNKGEITSVSAKHGALLMTDLANVNLYSGTLTGSPNGDGIGGNIRLNGGVGKIYAAVLRDGKNSNTANPKGGNICLSKKAEMTIYGGVIKNGTALNGANIYAYGDAKLTIEGGSIIDGNGNANIALEGKAEATIKNLDATTTVVIGADTASLNTILLDSSVTKSENAGIITLTKTVVTPAPTPTPTPTPTPSTGDSANLVVMGLGLVLGVAGMVCLLPKKQSV